MPLNLGNLIPDDTENMSFDDAYIEWLEADRKHVNLMNAIEIAEKAKISGSTECIRFAEDLLGCNLNEFAASMEVQYRKAAADGSTPTYKNPAKYAHYITKASPEVAALGKTLLIASRKLRRAESRLTRNDKIQRVIIPPCVLDFTNESYGSGGKEYSISEAIQIYKNALNAVKAGNLSFFRDNSRKFSKKITI